MKYLVIPFFIFLLNINHVYSQNKKLINYEELKELTTVQTLEIGARENYIPGKLKDVVVTSNSIIVSDIQKKTIEQFDKQGNYVATIAQEGKGPGELPSYFNVIDLKDNSFLVWHNAAQRLDFYELEKKNEVYKYTKSKTADSFISGRLDIVGPYSKGRFYALTGHADKTLIKLNLSDYRMVPVSVVNDNLEVVHDSVQMIEAANFLFGKPEKYNSSITMDGLGYLGIPPYRYEDHFLLMENNHYMIARAGSASFIFYNKEHEVKKKVTLNIKRSRVSQSDLKLALSKIDWATNDKIKTELKRHVREVKPLFLDVWISEKHILLFTDYGKQGKKMILLSIDGKPLGKFLLPYSDNIEEFKDEKLITIHKDPNKGDSIRIYELKR